MGTLLNHPTRIKHEATLAIERELFGADAVFDRNPVETLIDFGLMPLTTDDVQCGDLVRLFNTESGRAAALQMAEQWSNAR